MVKENNNCIVKRGMVFDYCNPRDASITGTKFAPKLILENGREINCTTLCGKRPVVVLSSNAANDKDWNCIIVPLRSMDNHTTKIDDSKCIKLKSSGVKLDRYADIGNITSVGQNELDVNSYIGALTEDDLDRIKNAIIERIS